MPKSADDSPNDAANDSVQVVAESPAEAMGFNYMSTSLALSLAALNATFNQMNSNILAHTTTARCVDLLLGGMPPEKSNLHKIGVPGLDERVANK